MISVLELFFIPNVKGKRKSIITFRHIYIYIDMYRHICDTYRHICIKVHICIIYNTHIYMKTTILAHINDLLYNEM